MYGSWKVTGAYLLRRWSLTRLSSAGHVDMSDREAVHSLQESLRDATPLQCPVTTQQYGEAMHARYSGMKGA